MIKVSNPTSSEMFYNLRSWKWQTMTALSMLSVNGKKASELSETPFSLDIQSTRSSCSNQKQHVNLYIQIKCQMIYTRVYLNNITCLSQLVWNDFEKRFPGILIHVLWNQASSGEKTMFTFLIKNLQNFMVSLSFYNYRSLPFQQGQGHTGRWHCFSPPSWPRPWTSFPSLLDAVLAT